MAKLIRQGENGGAVVELDREQVVFGRDESCDVVVTKYAKLSRQHCGFKRYADGVVTVTDFGSRNGTFVNGAQIFEETTLHHGDQVRICDGLEFAFHDPPPASSPLPANPLAAAPPKKVGDRTEMMLPFGQRRPPPGAPPPVPLPRPSAKPAATGRHSLQPPTAAAAPNAAAKLPSSAVLPVVPGLLRPAVPPPPPPPPPPAPVPPPPAVPPPPPAPARVTSSASLPAVSPSLRPPPPMPPAPEAGPNATAKLPPPGTPPVPPPPPPAVPAPSATTRIADEVDRELKEKSFHEIMGEIARKTRKKPPPDDRPNVYF